MPGREDRALYYVNKRTTLGERSRGRLAISPNLDAFLEYEERIRGITGQVGSGFNTG